MKINSASASAPSRWPVARTLRTMVAVSASMAVLLGITAVPAQAAADLDPPVVKVVDFPSRATPGDSVTATWRITDATGVEAGQVRASLGPWTASVPPTRVSGTDQDATYTATWVVPPDARHLESYWLDISSRDKAGNVTDRGDGQAYGDITVYDTDDNEAPAVGSVEIPGTVKAGDSLTATFRITDATGVGASAVMAGLFDSRPYIFLGTESLTRVSGTDQDATYTATWVINPVAGDGDYTLRIWGSDAVGNGAFPGLPEGYATVTVYGGDPVSDPAAAVKVKAKDRKSKLYVNVNPNKGKGYWKFQVQKQRANGTWKTYQKTYQTRGNGETRKLNFKKGTYRVKVKAKYGYQGTTSDAVWLRR